MSDLSDDACCNSALDCAYNSQCYSSGWIGCAPWNSDLKVRCSTTSTVWYLEENCVNKLSSDSDGGDKPLVAGICKDYGACVGSDCLSADYADICIDPVTLREYYSIQGDPASELGCPNKLYGCASFEQAATDTDAGDDPDNDGLCTGGVSAGCQGNAFVTPAGQSGTDQCYGSCSAGSGNDRCKWREYYPADSTDSCPAADTCATHDYDVDNSQHVCEGCSLNWVASGESPSGPGEYNFPGEIACCGDDAGENYINNEGMEGCCALPQGQSCFWSDACHTGWQAGGHEACVQGIDGLCTDSSGVDPGSSCYDDIDNDCDNTKDFGSIASSFNGADTDCMGRLKGRITNLGGIALSGVTVTVVSKIEYAGVFTTFDVTTETDADGNYEFNNNLPGNLRYDIVASKPGYEDAKLGNVFLPFRSENTADLQLRFVSLCEPDCSFASDAICHAECEGINGCSFYDLTAKTVCDGVHTDFDRQYNATHKVSCCKGAPYLPSDIKAVVEIQGAKNIVNIVRNVWYDGRFVKMVISVFR
ncbi:hypothetical protein COV22_01435 [Candidatus Woesearchaeota archaeon CG10_big_fil_rev_8_21_14_0_10_47_5]|nr:MAG: hypothetical protein COV22_01435 [Candidatus Woesearchaeota archaeon CG10_big_fil_rev_8_21_14_0_10_47_5]